jgi:zinc transport system permease protein
MLEFGFMQRALAAALLVGAVCGALGFFVVLRRMAFVGVGVAHSAVGGVALGVVLGVDPLASGALFGVAVALGIARASRSARLSEDAVIGVFFSGSMALAVVLFSLQRGYQPDLFGYLFGNVLAIAPRELGVLAAVAAAILLALAATFREQLFVAFDEEIARAYGHRVERLNALLLVLVAAAVVVGMRLVGALLVEALLVVPAAVAALWTEDWRRQVALSVTLAMASGAAGLAAAWHLDIAAGGAIALVAAAVFFASLALRRAPR